MKHCMKHQMKHRMKSSTVIIKTMCFITSFVFDNWIHVWGNWVNVLGIRLLFTAREYMCIGRSSNYFLCFLLFLLLVLCMN